MTTLRGFDLPMILMVKAASVGNKRKELERIVCKSAERLWKVLELEKMHLHQIFRHLNPRRRSPDSCGNAQGRSASSWP